MKMDEKKWEKLALKKDAIYWANKKKGALAKEKGARREEQTGKICS